jgi:hypothetical protein
MAGHPSVKKRQKELERKERQAEKLARRDERRVKRNEPATEGDAVLLDEFGEPVNVEQPNGEQPNGEQANGDRPKPVVDQPATPASVVAEVPAAPPRLTAQVKP